MNVDVEKFKETVKAHSEVEIEFTKLINNIRINEDGNIESYNGQMYVVMSPDYEMLEMAGGVSPEASRAIMNSDNDECEINE